MTTSNDLLARADAHMVRFPTHDLVAKLVARIRELETREYLDRLSCDVANGRITTGEYIRALADLLGLPKGPLPEPVVPDPMKPLVV